MQTPETLAKSNQMDRATLVLIGASVRAAAQSARRGGYRIIGIDLFGDTDTRELCDEFYLLSPENQQMARPPLADRMLAAIRGLPVLPVGGLRRWPVGLQICDLPMGGLPSDRSPGSGGDQPLEAFRNFDDLPEFADDETICFPETIHAATPPRPG